jgi:hypothetical protein
LIRLDSAKEMHGFPLIYFDRAWLDLAKFGKIWDWLRKPNWRERRAAQTHANVTWPRFAPSWSCTNPRHMSDLIARRHDATEAAGSQVVGGDEPAQARVEILGEALFSCCEPAFVLANSSVPTAESRIAPAV